MAGGWAYPASVTADSFEEWRARTHRANADLSQLAIQLQFGYGERGRFTGNPHEINWPCDPGNEQRLHASRA